MARVRCIFLLLAQFGLANLADCGDAGFIEIVTGLMEELSVSQTHLSVACPPMGKASPVIVCFLLRVIKYNLHWCFSKNNFFLAQPQFGSNLNRSVYYGLSCVSSKFMC